MIVWVLYQDFKLVGIYEDHDKASKEKDQLMNEQMYRDKPKSCTLIRMETIK